MDLKVILDATLEYMEKRILRHVNQCIRQADSRCTALGTIRKVPLTCREYVSHVVEGH